MHTPGFSEFSKGTSAFAAISNSNQPVVTPLEITTSEILNNVVDSTTTPAVNPSADTAPPPNSGDAGIALENVGSSALGSISSQPITPLPSTASDISNNVGASTEPAVDCTTLPASSVEATIPLLSGGTGFGSGNVGSAALVTTSSQPASVPTSSSGFSNNVGPSIQTTGDSTTASPIAAATLTPPIQQLTIGTSTPASPFAATPSYFGTVGTSTTTSPFAAASPCPPVQQLTIGTSTPASPFASTPSFFGTVGTSTLASPFASTPSFFGTVGTSTLASPPYSTFGDPVGTSTLASPPYATFGDPRSSSFSFSTSGNPLVQPAVGSFVPSSFRPSPPAGFVPNPPFNSCPVTPFNVEYNSPFSCSVGPMLQSISAMPVYIDKSHEELRCIDYLVGDKGGWVQKHGGENKLSGNSAFGPAPAPTQPPSWGGFQSSIFGKPSRPASPFSPFSFGSPSRPASPFSSGFGGSTVPVSASSDFESGTPYVRPRWGSRVASYTPTAELEQSGWKFPDVSSSTNCPAEAQDTGNSKQMDKKKMQDLQKAVESESEVERLVSGYVPKVDKVESEGKQLDASSRRHCPAEPQDKENDKQMDMKKLKDLRKVVEVECEVERRVSAKHIAFLNSMLEKLDSLSI